MNKILNFKLVSIITPILLCLITIAIYALNINGDFVYDDSTYFIRNDVITTISPFDFSALFLTATNLWGEVLPFRDFLYIIQYKAFGDWTTGYHMVSIFLFICSYFALFKLVQILVKNHIQFKAGVNVSRLVWLTTIIITSIFLFHPIYVESFNYISGQKDALSLLFILLSVYFIYRAGRLESNVILFFILGVFFHYIAILSKLSALSSIPFIPILFLITSTLSRKKIILLITTWLLANIPVIFWFFHIMTISKSLTPYIETAPLLERIPRAINIIGYHVTHIFKPWPLNFGYPFNINWIIDIYFILGVLFISVFSIVAILKRNKFVLLGFFIFILYLLPVLCIYPDINNDKVYDRYLAFPFIGILFSLIPVIIFFLSKNKTWKRIALIFCALIICLLGYFTSKYVPVFQNQLIAAEHTYKYFPHKKNAFFTYVNIIINNRELDKAEEIINNKIELKTEDGEKNYMLGRIYMERRHFIKAIELFRISSQQSTLSGNFIYADGPLAKTYMIMGRYDEAKQVLLKIIEKNPQSPTLTYRAKKMLQEVEQLKAQQLLYNQ